MSNKPRSEYFLQTVQTSRTQDYKPEATRDPRLAELFKGKPRGIVIGWQQQVAARAARDSFEDIVNAGDLERRQELSGLIAVTALGSAYHTFAQNNARHVMYKRAQFAEMVDPETKARTSEQELLEKAAEGLDNVVAGSERLYEIIGNKGTEKQRAKADKSLGLVLATTSFRLAAIRDGLVGLTEGMNEDDAQWEAWQSAQGVYEEGIGLAHAIKVRPTLAQLPDNYSPLRIRMNSDRDLISQDVHEVLMGRIDEHKKAA